MKKETNRAKVTVANFVRAETDHMIRANMKAFGVKIGSMTHGRKQPTTPDNQPVSTGDCTAGHHSGLLT